MCALRNDLAGIFCGPIQIIQRCCQRIFCLPAGKTLIIRSGGNQQDDFVRLADVQNISVNRNLAAAIQDTDASDIANAFAVRAVVKLTGHQQTVVTVASSFKSLRAVKSHVEGNPLSRPIALKRITITWSGALTNISRVKVTPPRVNSMLRHRVVEIQFPAVIVIGALVSPGNDKCRLPST